MFIVVHHRISDPEVFRALGEHPQSARPKHWRLHHLLPDPSGTRCICAPPPRRHEARTGAYPFAT